MAGHIIAVIGGKGGVGKSVFAANLAIAYQQDFKQRPLIIDLDLGSLGDQNIILGLNPPKNIVDVSKIPGGVIDPKSLTPFLVHAQGGYSFIGAPRETIMARDLDLDGLGKFLKSVTKIFNLSVIDCGSVSEPYVLKILEHATAIFVVSAADIIVLNQTKRVLSKIHELLFPNEMVQIIVNKYSQRSAINPQIIQRNLGRPIFAAIPDDSATCEAALSKNVPLCVSAPNTQVAKAFHELVRKLQQQNLLERLATLNKPKDFAARVQSAVRGAGTDGNSSKNEESDDVFGRSHSADIDPWTAMKLRLHKALVEKMDLKKTNTDTRDAKQRAVLREKTNKVILELIQTEDTGSLLSSRELKAQMAKEVLDEALGLGPLEDLLADDKVTEIMVNARNQIYIEKSGKNQMSKVTFSSEQQMMNVVERIITPLGKRVDEKMPYVDARLQDGSRVHIIIPPLALKGPTITIRKFPKERIGIKEYLQWGTLTQEIADFLRCCVEAKLNVVVSGGTGTGKTTLLNVLSNFIPSKERIITVEDSAELQLTQEHLVRLESKNANIEGEGEVSIRDLIKCCLRMRPDRIVVGECRDGSALDMLQAMNTGHSGSLTTVHSNSPRECLTRLETLVMMAGLGLPSKAIKDTISSAVNLIVQIARLSDGTRRITHISEITGMQGEVISLQDVFLYKQEGMDKRRQIKGRFIPTGFIPKFVEEMEAKGLKISRSLFASSK